jgi:hypothetical protein
VTATKRPVGRPRLGDEVGRPRSLIVPDEQWETWTTAAQTEGVTLGAWLRDAATRKLKSRARSRR